jgi:hypothetical protein
MDNRFAASHGTRFPRRGLPKTAAEEFIDMQRAVLVGAGMALAVGFTVGVRTSATSAATISESMSQSDAPLRVHRERPGLKPGMVVLDRLGARVGVITELGQTRDGRPAVTVNADGTPIKVDVSRLRVTREGDEAVVSLTRSELLTSAILNTPP